MTTWETKAPRHSDDFERVAIEAIHVGDYVLLDTCARPAHARCVIKKCAKANERTARVVGWLLELSGGDHAWWQRGQMVWRRRATPCSEPQAPASIDPRRHEPRRPRASRPS